MTDDGKQKKGISLRFLSSVFRHPGRGSVLIDVMFGTVIIAVVVTSLFLALALANRIALRAKHVAIAKDVAETEVEKIRRTAYASLTIGTTTSTVATLPTGQLDVTTAYFDPPDNEVIQATATVTWRERQGTETFVLTTLATEGGVGL